MLSDVIGIHYILFQQFSQNFIKCWIDGSEDWTLMEFEKFLNLSQKEKEDYKTLIKLKDCLTESSTFLWIIDTGEIRRLVPDFNQESLVLEIQKVLK